MRGEPPREKTEYTAVGTPAGLGPGLSSALGGDLEVTPTAKRTMRKKQCMPCASVMHKAYTVFVRLGD